MKYGWITNGTIDGLLMDRLRIVNTLSISGELRPRKYHGDIVHTCEVM